MQRSPASAQVLQETNTPTLGIMIIAFYRFQSISDPLSVQQFFLNLGAAHGLKGTILVSHEGINGTIAGAVDQIRAFQSYLNSVTEWSGLEFKESYAVHQTFRRFSVKLKKEIIPVGDDSVRPAESTAPAIESAELKKWLDEGREFTLLDTRNDYEIALGTFQGAVKLGLRHFRNFRRQLKAQPLKMDQPLVMFCTGGIRCEKASVVAQQEGFKEVYQLKGGILKYFEEVGSDHYEGRCFVFDERIAVDAKLKPYVDVELYQPPHLVSKKLPAS